MIENLVCPRCENLVPNNGTPGAYPGALSRTDNNTEICSKCGELEALEEMMYGLPLQQKHWIINR